MKCTEQCDMRCQIVVHIYLPHGVDSSHIILSFKYFRLDSAAFMCELCRQTFMVNAKPDLLYQHVTAKHPSGTDYKACFPVLLADFDPEDPKGEKKAKAEKAAAAAAVKKVVKKKDDGLDMLSAGLGAGKKKKKF
jgi:hypothetical protein